MKAIESKEKIEVLNDLAGNIAVIAAQMERPDRVLFYRIALLLDAATRLNSPKNKENLDGKVKALADEVWTWLGQSETDLDGV